MVNKREGILSKNDIKTLRSVYENGSFSPEGKDDLIRILFKHFEIQWGEKDNSQGEQARTNQEVGESISSEMTLTAPESTSNKRDIGNLDTNSSGNVPGGKDEK